MRFVHDKELGGGGVHAVTSSCHGNDAALMGEIVDDAVASEFALDGLVRASDAGAQRVTALNHEAGDDAVENDAGIEIAVAKIHEVCNGDRSDLRIQLQLDIIAGLHIDLYVYDIIQICGGIASARGEGEQHCGHAKSQRQKADHFGCFHLVLPFSYV